MKSYEVAIYLRVNSKKPNRKEYFDTLGDARTFAKDFKNHVIKECEVLDNTKGFSIVSYSYGDFYYKSF